MENNFDLSNKPKLSENNLVVFPEDWKIPLQLVPHPEIKTVLNGKQVFKTVDVTKDDHIEIYPRIPLNPGKINISVATNQLFAYIQLKPALQVQAIIELEQKSDGFSIKTMPKAKKFFLFTREEVLEALKEKGVIYGINEENLSALLSNPSDTRILIASGQPSKAGIDESMKILFETSRDKRPEIFADGRADFKRNRILSVDVGQTLGVKLPGKLGESGIGVDGKSIAPPDIKRIKIREGNGTRVQQEGFSVVATHSGLPVLQEAGDVYFFQVVPIYNVKEVNLETGNLEFNGDIQVEGNVKEGMSVLGSGNVVIGESVYEAKITSLGNLSVRKNVISSFLNAGGMSVFLEGLKGKLDYFENTLKDMYQYLCLISQRMEQINKKVCPGQLIVGLINKKFTNVSLEVNEMKKMIQKKEFVTSCEIENLFHELDIKFKRLGWLKALHIDEVEELRKRVNMVKDKIFFMSQEKKGDIIVAYANNSSIEAAGDVRVMGEGCINTNINAKGNVLVDAVFRGGVIVSQGIVTINEAGSEMGVKTVIKTNGKPIRINKAYHNVVLMVDEQRKMVNNTEYKIYMKNEN